MSAEPDAGDVESLTRLLSEHQTQVTVMGGWSRRNGKDSDRNYGWSCSCGTHSPDAFKIDLTCEEADAGRFGHIAERLAAHDAEVRRDTAEQIAQAIEAGCKHPVGQVAKAAGLKCCVRCSQAARIAREEASRG